MRLNIAIIDITLSSYTAISIIEIQVGDAFDSSIIDRNVEHRF